MTFLGDSSQLSFEVSPLKPSWERTSPPDSGPWASLKIIVRERCLTRVIEPQTRTERLDVNVPLLALANWLVRNIRAVSFEENPALYRGDAELHETLKKWSQAGPAHGTSEEEWDDQRFEWYARHFWLSGSDGASLPDVGLVRADEKLWVSWRPRTTAGARPLEFVENSACEPVDWSVALDAIASFVEFVRSETPESASRDYSWLKSPKPIQDAVRCTAAEYVQLVAPQAQNMVTDLSLSNEDPESSPPLLALRDLDVTGDYDAARASLQLLIQRLAGGAAQTDRETWRAQLNVGFAALPAEEVGHETAREVRARLGLDGNPISDDKLRDVIESMAKCETVQAATTHNQTAIGALQNGPAAVVLFENDRTSRRWVRRFELARALGHLLLDAYTPRGVLGAGASRLSQGVRRKRSGAFAAELLMPRSGIEDILRGRDPAEGKVFAELTSHFAIGASAAAYQLWNEGFLVSTNDRDSLIEEYGSEPGKP